MDFLETATQVIEKFGMQENFGTFGILSTTEKDNFSGTSERLHHPTYFLSFLGLSPSLQVFDDF